jgi:beta-galactosidase
MRNIFLLTLLLLTTLSLFPQRVITDLNNNWRFHLGDDSLASNAQYNDKQWRQLNLPHDWSIEGTFSDKHPTTSNQAALPAGVGWYRKTFTLPANLNNKSVYIAFDGVHRNSEVWINGHYLGKRPNGYISFRYDLTAHVLAGKRNVIAVKVDDSAQPTSRWYTGSGIYRNVRLIATAKTAIDEWGVFVTTPKVSTAQATVNVNVAIRKDASTVGPVNLQTTVYNQAGKVVATKTAQKVLLAGEVNDFSLSLLITNPSLWSVDKPVTYKLVTKILRGSAAIDEYETNFGIRYLRFDPEKGFFLNGKPLKILGVCNHHDLGALGAAVNVRAMQRQLEILKAMGCNSIRTAHNPPAPELLDLCDRMGFLVMDEAFDMWAKRKNRFDYHLDFPEWHKRDVQDQVKRDRNHPSVIIWSIGNEIREQFDSTGLTITKELVDIVKQLDTTRPVTCALTENFPEKNFIYRSGALDVLGFNYKLAAYPELPGRFPGYPLIATETSSALASRGEYFMPSDSIRLMPPDSRTKFATGNPHLKVSAYDHAYAYWGSTHEAGWNAVKKYPFIAGIYVWAGFDFLGEPVPYPYPARSSYYGLIDLAGFPKDSYYMYQSEWTNEPVLHLFPHWNWQEGKPVDLWVYYNQADEVELYLNGRSLGAKKKEGDALHVMWRVNFAPGTLRAVSRRNGKTVLTREIKTAGKPAKIQLLADRDRIKADGKDLSFITVKILDAAGNVVPDADNLVRFNVKGEGMIAAVDNGSPTSKEPFNADHRKAYNGLCLAVIKSKAKRGNIVLEATAHGLRPAKVTLTVE